MLNPHGIDNVQMTSSLSDGINGGGDYFFRWLGGTAGRNPAVRYALEQDAMPYKDSTGWTLAAASADLTGNGLPDLYIANDFGADGVEMLSHSDDATAEYYRYLNSGYRLPLVGGTDKMSSAVPVGLYRTYARLDEEFSYEAWCRAVRAGRTFLSGGRMGQAPLPQGAWPCLVAATTPLARGSGARTRFARHA